MEKKPQLNVQLEHKDKELFDRIERDYGMASKDIARSLIHQFLQAYDKTGRVAIQVEELATIVGQARVPVGDAPPLPMAAEAPAPYEKKPGRVRITNQPGSGTSAAHASGSKRKVS